MKNSNVKLLVGLGVIVGVASVAGAAIVSKIKSKKRRTLVSCACCEGCNECLGDHDQDEKEDITEKQ